MEQWEYDVEVKSPDKESEEKKILNERGKKGWELCSINSHSVYTGTTRYYWKRKLVIAKEE